MRYKLWAFREQGLRPLATRGAFGAGSREEGRGKREEGIVKREELKNPVYLIVMKNAVSRI
ncbi:hypothetical protein BJP34_02610 [Moorena producens PAL-8-15-08-1]|uniref:Uncharacterized protein n=1 Tax=Moorena producens PAL-8-15-08-1 TaxID=1458985 RepID=A0A1D8TM33_9CYAN|nr:hypothetical protein [Moorena producens]AOW98485.1 hypothetical protein BJP34_02610 [Moorena producens PAL-8-15-08-1]